jgi:hypothetical protein
MLSKFGRTALTTISSPYPQSKLMSKPKKADFIGDIQLCGEFPHNALGSAFASV